MFYARILEPNLTALPDATVGGIRVTSYFVIILY